MCFAQAFLKWHGGAQTARVRGNPTKAPRLAWKHSGNKSQSWQRQHGYVEFVLTSCSPLFFGREPVALGFVAVTNTVCKGVSRHHFAGRLSREGKGRGLAETRQRRGRFSVCLFETLFTSPCFSAYAVRWKGFGEWGRWCGSICLDEGWRPWMHAMSPPPRVECDQWSHKPFMALLTPERPQVNVSLVSEYSDKWGTSRWYVELLLMYWLHLGQFLCFGIVIV